MRYITRSILLALALAALVMLFLIRYAQSRQRVLPTGGSRLTFAGKCHPMEARDRLPILLITLIYAATAFFQLGDLTAPQSFYDLGSRDAVTIQLTGAPVRAGGVRYYTGLGTGSYNVEVSQDGERWYTLWARTNDKGETTSWYWADAQGYAPSYALTQEYNELFKWLDVKVDDPLEVRFLRLTGKADPKTITVTSADGATQSRTERLLELGRLVLLDEKGQVAAMDWAPAGNTQASEELTALFDTEGVPEKSTWHNSAYFDEIYHARTAKENIDNVYPYEWTHPPLGKLILSVGIRLFGMTPFGWRFMGTLFGVMMLPILYVFLKNLFGKTLVASCGAILFAADFMHLTQTRIATIDTYGVFFILCMYFFMYRYLTLPAGTPFRRGALPLFLSGLMWGLGLSSKWTVIYGALGLAVLYFMGFYQKLRDWPREAPVRRGPWAAQILLFSVLVFLLIPFGIYTLSYLPYARALEIDVTLPGTLKGLGEAMPVLLGNVADKLTGAAQAEGYRAGVIPTDTLGGIMAQNQWAMFTYHQGVSQAHPYSSRWFQWIVDARPILYYMDNIYDGAVMTHTVRFAAFSNPLVCWAGLGAMILCAAHTFRRLWAKLVFLVGLTAAAAVCICRAEQTENGAFAMGFRAFFAGEGLEPERAVFARNLAIFALCLVLFLLLSLFLLWAAPGHSGKAAFLLVGYLSQLAPWWLISRTTFEYHYFPSILFLVLGVSYLFDGLLEAERGRGYRKSRGMILGLTGLGGGLYALFYPVLIGLTIPAWYIPLVKWIESWPF